VENPIMEALEAFNAKFMLTLLAAIERRDLELVRKLYHPDIEFHWPPGLPYSGVFKGETVAKMQECFASVWFPLQPTAERRRMDSRVVATSPDGRVVVNYIWKGESPDGVAFETETLADYQVDEGRLLRAQMFYYDLPGVIDFLKRCGIGNA
jgi:ketosteroid isomerase-like protein